VRGLRDDGDGGLSGSTKPADPHRAPAAALAQQR
jgi:hypothetical protein